MNKETVDDVTFKLLANPYKLKKKEKKKVINEDDELFIKIKKRYPGMVIFKSDKVEILKKIESILTEVTIANIIDNIVKEIEYDLLL